MITAILCAVWLASPVTGPDGRGRLDVPASPDTNASSDAVEETPAATSSGRFQIHAARIFLGDGNRIDDGVLVVEDGKILRVGRGVELDPRYPVIEHDGVLSAGIVACETHGGSPGETFDAARTVLPEARLVYAFDPDHSDFEKALRAGITSMEITPSPRNLAGGISVVVKSLEGRVLKREAHLALSITGSSLSQGAGNTFSPFAAAAGGGPENARGTRRGARRPTSYPGAIHELERLFAGSSGVFARAARGELSVLFEAWDRNEVERVLAFARRHDLRGAVRGAPLAGELAERFRASGMAAILGPYRPGQTRRSLESLGRLSEAGVPVAFALDAPEHAPEELRLSAAMAITAGAEPVQAWKALTTDAARIAGVDDRVGSLAKGKDADLVLWSGDPLNLTSRVVAVYVDGELAYQGDGDE